MILGLRPVLALLALAACAAEPSPPEALEPQVIRSTQRYTREYVLQPGDQIEVAVFRVPELTRSVVVRADGYVSLPLVKEVKVTGLTIPELNADLARRYSDRLNAPDVTVTVLNPKPAAVYVLGEVYRPGPVPVREAPTLALALAAAGGTLRTGSFDNVAIIRIEDDGVLAGYIVPRRNYGETSFYQAMFATPLRVGDLIVVPESGRSQFVRFVQDFINTPLTGVNQTLTPYFQFETLRLVSNR